jgi:hypothetical protein
MDLRKCRLIIETEDSEMSQFRTFNRLTLEDCGITGVSDFIHRPDFNNYKKKEQNNVSETGSVSVLT